MEWKLLDIGSIAVTIALVEWLKPLVKERFIPLLPFLFGYLVAVVVVANAGCSINSQEFLTKWILEGLKIALSSMASYKIYKTTIKGDGLNDNELNDIIEKDDAKEKDKE